MTSTPNNNDSTVNIGAMLQNMLDESADAAKEQTKKILRTDRAMPADPDAERAILAACINDGASAVEAIKAEGVTFADFDSTKHAAIFAAIEGVFDAGDAIDVISVTNYLQTKGKLNVAGGTQLIVQLANTLAFSSAIPTHCRIVKEKAALRAVIKAAQDMAESAYKQQERASSILDKAASTVNNAAMNHSAATPAREIGGLLDELFGSLPIFGGKVHKGISTGYKALDEMLHTGGFNDDNGDLVVLAARPSVGKSAFALNLMHRMGKSSVPTTFISLEMNDKSLGMRLLSMDSGVQTRRPEDHTEMDGAKLLQAKARLSTMPIAVKYAAGYGIDQITSLIRSEVKQRGIKVVFIDYLGLLNLRDEQFGTRSLAIGDATRKLKVLAGELKIAVVLLAQLNREVEKRTDKKPQLADLRESGAIEQDADVILFLHRPDDTAEARQMGAPHACNVIVGKNRNGAVGEIELVYVPKTTAFKTPKA